MTEILHCDKPECPKQWENLAPSGESGIRICTECLRAVYLCESQEEAEAREAAAQPAVIR